MANTAGEWKAWKIPLKVSNAKTSQIKAIFNQNKETSTIVAKACKKSTTPISVLRLHRSTKTPAKGDKITMGAKPKKDARDKYRALPVSRVIHQIMTNCAMDEPNNEASCPDQKNR